MPKPFNRLRLNGDVEAGLGAPNHNGCRLWLGFVAKDGYGRIMIGGRPRLVHRVWWERYRGPIPPSLQIDHYRLNDPDGASRCNRACAVHTRLATQLDNLRASPRTRASVNAAKAACPAGHPYIGDNVAWERRRLGRIGRRCRICKNRQSRQRWLAR